MADEARPRPFHERFDIDVGTDVAKRYFINRAINDIFDFVRDGVDYSWYLAVKKAVASSLGERYVQDNRIEGYVRGNFQRCLQALEAVYEATANAEEVSERISSIVRQSEVDLGVDWQPPYSFVQAHPC